MRRVVAILVLAGVACSIPAAKPAVAEPSSGLPSPSPTAGVLLVADEKQVWARVRGEIPGAAPVTVPIWMPPSVDRGKVQLRALSVLIQDPRYTVAYTASTSGDILFSLGPAPEVRLGEESGVGVRVRG